METIGKSEVWSFCAGSAKALPCSNSQIRSDRGHAVVSYLDLATKIAELQFRNREHVLLLRGQNADHLNQKKNTTLKPSMFRPVAGSRVNPSGQILRARFEHLENAERALVIQYKAKRYIGLERLQRHRILRWAILQHYEVCRTPLLDVSHSLRIAASFASMDAKGPAVLYVLGIPNVSGAVSASAEANVQTIRLSSVCPPVAVRPHIQEGYLLGEYPELTSYQQKQEYRPFEIDFGRRLVAKFKFNPAKFWSHKTFPKVAKEALYPDNRDEIFRVMRDIKNQIGICP